jgi:hypothetical protein
MGRVAIDLGLAVLLATGFLLVGFAVGRDYERTNAIAATSAAPVLELTKNSAWRCGANRRQRKPRRCTWAEVTTPRQMQGRR